MDRDSQLASGEKIVRKMTGEYFWGVDSGEVSRGAVNFSRGKCLWNVRDGTVR